MDIRVINHDHEAIDAIDGPVDEPEAMTATATTATTTTTTMADEVGGIATTG